MIIYFKIEDEFAIKHYIMNFMDVANRDGAFLNSVVDVEVIKKILKSGAIVTVLYKHSEIVEGTMDFREEVAARWMLNHDAFWAVQVRRKFRRQNQSCNELQNVVLIIKHSVSSLVS